MPEFETEIPVKVRVSYNPQPERTPSLICDGKRAHAEDVKVELITDLEDVAKYNETVYWLCIEHMETLRTEGEGIDVDALKKWQRTAADHRMDIFGGGW